MGLGGSWFVVLSFVFGGRSFKLSDFGSSPCLRQREGGLFAESWRATERGVTTGVGDGRGWTFSNVRSMSFLRGFEGFSKNCILELTVRGVPTSRIKK